MAGRMEATTSYCATKTCCKLNCLASVTKEECARVKLGMCAMSLKEQKSWLLTTFSTAYCMDSHKFHHMLCGKSICSRAFTDITGISKSRYYEVRSSFLQGQFQVMKTSPSTRFHVGPELAMQWLKLYATDHGDKLPNHERVLLPCSLTKQAVYEHYSEEYSTSPYKISKSSFLAHWKKSCSHIAIPKRSRFTKCTLCDILAKKIPAEQDKEKRELLTSTRQAHLDRVRKEREKYYHHCAKAKHDTQKYLTLIIDGMDQQKTLLPHYVSQSKAMSNKQQLKVQVTGVLTHGHGAFTYLQYGQYSCDSNQTITVLVKCLEQISPLPDVVYIQMDNCTGQNKNKYVLAFLAHLIQEGVFRKIKLSFLPVGHTHEDVDQMFSRFSSYLDKNDAVTPNDLKASFLSSYTPSPKVLDLLEVWDIKEWLKESIEDIHTHTRPHHFKFKLVDGQTEVKYKYWSDDPEWLPSEKTEDESESGEENAAENEDDEEDEPLHILKHPHTVSSSVPIVPPDLDSLHLDQLLIDLSRLPQDYISAEKKREWEEFVANLKSSKVQSNVTKQLPRLCVTRRSIPSATRSSSSSAMSLPPSIQTLVDKENDRPPIYIGKRAYKLRASTSLKSHDDIKEGDLVAVMPDEEQYVGQPWIAQCLSRPTQENTITVQWFRGSLTRPWVPDRRYDPFDIDLTTIINTVEFTPTHRLTRSSLEVVKEALKHF